ncbi:MAG: hypothetical protein SPL53_08025 [Bacteroidales bacterium]|nr:hypothetical protein [Bacteroidales bacterium]
MLKKIFCLLCCIVAFVLPSWAGGSNYYFKVTATAQPTGAGKVYVAENPNSAPADGDAKWKDEAEGTGREYSSGQAASKNFWLYAKPNEGYVLVNWTKADGSVQGANKMQSTGVLSSSEKDANNPAAFTFTAHFAKAGAVVVKTADEKLGDVSIDNPTNAVGDQVTLTATADMFASRFTGWTTPSGAVVKDNPYTFTVTEANKGTYIANYEKTDVSTTGIYCFVHNVKFKRSLGLMGVSDKTVSSSNRYLKNSIMLLEDGSDIMRSSPAFVLKLTGKSDEKRGADNVSLEAQGMESKKIANKTFSFTNQGDHFYITGSAGGVTAYMVDYNDAFTQEEHVGKVNHPGLYNGANEGDASYHWVVTPITEDSKDFCFGAMPSPKTKDEAGKYYTTMYTKFPYRCLDGVKAYVVSSVDTKAHKVVLTLIESGEVPSGTPVVLECTSTKPVENRLLPLVEEPAAIDGDNRLKGEIWLKDENKTEGEYRTKFDSQTMLVLSNEQLAFKNVNNTDVLAGGTATGTLTYIANNTCYLQVSSEMTEATTFTIEKGTTLAGLSQEAADGVTPYKLTGNDLECVGAIASDSYKYLVVKDGGHSTETTSNKQGYREYLIRSSYNGGKENTTRQTAYDQSNWILVDLLGIAGAQVDNYRNCKITSITGTYHKENPRFVATQIVPGDKTAPYAPNHYIATNFMTTYSADGTGNAVEDAAGNTYYFMNPKDGEWAIVAWAVWDKAKQAFYVPANDDEGTNAHGFTGGFKVDLCYNEGGITDVKTLDEQSDKGQNVYTFPALIVKNTATSASAPRRAAIKPNNTRELSTTYTVYPLSLSAVSVVTGVSTVDQAKTVSSVVYYNLQGMASPTPHAGLNVVVTRYTDGSTQVAKVMRP